MAVWLDIKKAPGYDVSSDGYVRNHKTGRILKTYLDRSGGYEKVKINGKNEYVHILVADRFYECGVKEGNKVEHIDGNRHKNCISNLRIINKSAEKSAEKKW